MPRKLPLSANGPRRGFLLALLASVTLGSCSYRFYEAACEEALPGGLHKHAVLDSTVRETSGLLWLDGKIWTFNDSGGEAALYCMDPGSGDVIRKTILRNAVNADWEDIAADATHIYVADVGNNFAARDTVRIYRVSRDAVLSGDPDLCHDGIISISFREEVKRTRTGYSSLDCEALLACGDSLYLFTKDWVGQSTSVYILPKEAGHYCLGASARYDARLLVTGADLFPERRQVSLVGYRDYMPVVITYRYGEDPSRIRCGGKARIYPLKSGRQVEGICYDTDGGLYISAEKTLQKPTLFRLGRPLR